MWGTGDGKSGVGVSHLTEPALGHRRLILARRFLGELIQRPTGKWSFPKRGLPSLRSSGNMATAFLQGHRGRQGHWGPCPPHPQTPSPHRTPWGEAFPQPGLTPMPGRGAGTPPRPQITAVTNSHGCSVPAAVVSPQSSAPQPHVPRLPLCLSACSAVTEQRFPFVAVTEGRQERASQARKPGWGGWGGGAWREAGPRWDRHRAGARLRAAAQAFGGGKAELRWGSLVPLGWGATPSPTQRDLKTGVSHSFAVRGLTPH